MGNEAKEQIDEKIKRFLSHYYDANPYNQRLIFSMILDERLASSSINGITLKEMAAKKLVELMNSGYKGYLAATEQLTDYKLREIIFDCEVAHPDEPHNKTTPRKIFIEKRDDMIKIAIENESGTLEKVLGKIFPLETKNHHCNISLRNPRYRIQLGREITPEEITPEETKPKKTKPKKIKQEEIKQEEEVKQNPDVPLD